MFKGNHHIPAMNKETQIKNIFVMSAWFLIDEAMDSNELTKQEQNLIVKTY